MCGPRPRAGAGPLRKSFAATCAAGMSLLPSGVRRITEGYGFFILILLGTIVFLTAMLSAACPPWRAVILAFVCGASVGVAEIVSRYRDEPLQASLSPFGLT